MSTRYENVWGHESNPSHNCDPRDESAYDADFLFEDFSSQRRNSSSQGSASDRDLEVCTHSHWNARSKKYRRNRICRCQCEQCKIDCADNDSYPMSRGGRGRGRGSRPNIPGYDYDTSLTIDSKPSELFPPYKIPVAAIPTEKEKREVAYYLGLREQIHKGPLYTAPQTRDAKPSKVYGEDQFNSQFHNKAKPDIDPFEGMPRYSWRYDQQKRAIPQLSARQLDKSLFPEELWSTLEGEEGKTVRNTINKGIKKKADMLSGSAKGKGASSDLTAEEKTQKAFEKIKNVFDADEADAEVDREEDEEDVQEEEKDYDYEEDEAEMGGDYGAEQYFDGGDGDDDDGMDAGGGDDY